MKTTILTLIILVTLTAASSLKNQDNNYPYWQNIKKSFNIDK